jgi:hypothetical protein
MKNKKYRIKTVIRQNGNKWYYPQKKWLFWWFYLEEDNLNLVTSDMVNLTIFAIGYSSIEEVKRIIRKHKNSSRKRIEVIDYEYI